MKVLLLFMCLGMIGMLASLAAASTNTNATPPALEAALNEVELAAAIKDLASDAAKLKERIIKLQASVAHDPNTKTASAPAAHE